MQTIALTTFDLALASSLILIGGALSIAFRLGLTRTLFWVTFRMVIQLGVIGLVLTFIFARQSGWLTFALVLVMGLVAGREVLARQERPLRGLWAYGLGTGAVLFSGVLTMLLAVAVIIQPQPWYAPRYVLPLTGMILGNSLTGTALALDTLTSAVWQDRHIIEARLALGQPRFLAMRTLLQRALKTGMMPMINAMAASGIVSLPGMMTGQIIAGADPVQATKYQILIMFLLTGATALAVFLAVTGSVFRLTDERHRLRPERLKQ